MKTNLFSRTLVIISAVAFTACDKQQPVAPEPEPDNILGNQFVATIPLAVGNKWVYRQTILDDKGAIQITRPYTNEITREFTDGTQHWFVLRTTLGESTAEIYVANINGAQYSRNAVDSLPLLYLIFSPSSFSSFNMDLPFPGLKGIPDTVIHVPCTISPTSSIVRVPMGRFFTFEYTTAQVDISYRSMNTTLNKSELLFSDQGLVSAVYYSDFQGNQYVSETLELTDITIR